MIEWWRGVVFSLLYRRMKMLVVVRVKVWIVNSNVV